MTTDRVTVCTCGHHQASHGRRDTLLVGTREVACCWALACPCGAWDPIVVAP